MLELIATIFLIVLASLVTCVALNAWFRLADKAMPWWLAAAGVATIVSVAAGASAALLANDTIAARALWASSIALFGTGVLLMRASVSAPPEVTICERPEPTRRIRLSDGRYIAVWTIAPPQLAFDAAVVYLHGGPGGIVSREVLEVTAPEFAAKGVRFHAYDQAGSGASDILLNPRHYTIETMVEDLEQLRCQLGEERIALLAGSWGSVIAARYAQRFPDRVIALILISPVAPTGLDYRTVDFSRTAQRRPVLPNSLRLALAMLLIRIAPELAQRFMSQKDSQPWAQAFAEHQLTGALHCADDPKGFTSSATVVNLYPAVRLPHSLKHYTDQTKVSLPSGIPGLIWRGDCDYLPRSVSEAYAAALMPSLLVEVSGEGHGVTFPNTSRAKKCAEWLTQQLSMAST